MVEHYCYSVSGEQDLTLQCAGTVFFVYPSLARKADAMALVECPECKKEISSRAASCPSCAYPMKSPEPSIAEVQTIELTSKSLKLQTVYAVLVFLTGALLTIVGSANDSKALIAIGMLSLLTSLVWFIVIKIRTWWRHK